MLFGETFHLIHIDALIALANGISHWLKPTTRNIDRRAMRKMAASGKIKTQIGVARLQQGKENSLVRLQIVSPPSEVTSAEVRVN